MSTYNLLLIDGPLRSQTDSRFTYDNITGIASVTEPPVGANDIANKNYVDSSVGSAGTVTSVSISSVNGITGVVTNPTTAPAIALTLGDITPSSVAASGSVSGSNLSGTNTGDQTFTLTNDVTGSGTGTIATTIANLAVTTPKIAAQAVTYGKMQLVTAQRLLGNNTLSSQSPTEISTDSSLGFSGGGIFQRSALTGDATASAGSNSVSVVGLRGNALSATPVTNLTGYVFISGANFLPVSIQFLLDQSFSSVTKSSVNGAEETIYSNSISGGIITVNGTATKYEFYGQCTAASTVKLYFGSLVTPIFTKTFGTLLATASFKIEMIVIRTANTTAKATMIFTSGDTDTMTTVPFTTVNYSAISGLDLANGASWKLTGTSNAGTNTITATSYRVYMA